MLIRHLNPIQIIASLKTIHKFRLIGRRTMCQINKMEKSKIQTMDNVKMELARRHGIGTSYSPAYHSRENLTKYEPKSIDELKPRRMQDSYSTAVIPLGTDEVLRDKYIQVSGKIRLGRLMEDMDLFAVWVIHQHVKVDLDPNIPLPYTFVTALVDKITFTSYIPRINSDILLSGHASWVGRSSVEITVWLDQKLEDRWQNMTKAIFMMAARNAINNKSLFVNPLVANTPEEKEIFGGGEDRRKRRMAIKMDSRNFQAPSEFEHKLAYNMFSSTIELKDQSLNKRKLPRKSTWMDSHALSNVIYSFPEDRNLHNRVFGGFLMRNALEISFTLACEYCRSRPKLLHISDIHFLHPVPVGAVIKLYSDVIYTEVNFIGIIVVINVFDTMNTTQQTTNNFFYVYSHFDKVKHIAPKSYHEVMWYLDGRRKFNYCMEVADSKSPRLFISESELAQKSKN